MTPRRLGVFATHSTEWHDARAGRIGGSDIGPLMGWSPWTTPQQLMESKINGATSEEMSAAQQRGILCESAVGEWLAWKESVTYDPEWLGTWVDSDRDWMMYNPDGVTTDGRLVEFKTVGMRTADNGWGRAGSDRVPLCYAAQVQWGLGILGLTQALLAVLSGGPRFEFARYKIKFDAEAFRAMRDEAEAFHDEMTRQAAA